jgi:hypothetical protein
MMTRYGRLHPEHYSEGGITSKARLAVFGEGRKPEAYVPLEDGKTIPVAVDSLGHSYVPLPGGRKIPVTMQTDAYSRLPDGNKLSAFADGGVMTSYGYGVFADGGVASYSDLPAPPPARGAAAGNKGTGGNTTFVIENHGATISAPQEIERPNGDKEIRFIIDTAKAEAKADIASDISSGRGGISTALKARGLDSSRTLQRRG